MANQLSLGQCAALACLMEVSAPKPGNVHRGADFEDVAFPDFIVSALAIAPMIDRAPQSSLGSTILTAVKATREMVGTNTNLGMILLFAPLASVPRNESLPIGVRGVLDQLTPADASDVYDAILLANPGGLGKVDQADVQGQAPDNLIDAMRLAADRDLVARQYVDGFSLVLQQIVPWLRSAINERKWPIADAVVYVFLQMLAAEPDSLIARKCGSQLATQASQRAARILSYGEPGNPVYHEAIADFDFWLRSDHHRRNPGTTADLIAAGLFACLRDGIIEAPFRLADSISFRDQ